MLGQNKFSASGYRTSPNRMMCGITGLIRDFSLAKQRLTAEDRV